MKASFFSVVALAMSAFAAPLVNLDADVKVKADVAVGVKPVVIGTYADLTVQLDASHKKLLDVTAEIDVAVKALGKKRDTISVQACVNIAAPALKKIVTILGDVKANLLVAAKAKIVADVKASVKADVAGLVNVKAKVKVDVNIVLNLLVKIVASIAVSIKALVVAVGLHADVKVLIKTVFSLLADVLGLTVGLVPTISATVIAKVNALLVVGIKATVLVDVVGTAFQTLAGLTACVNLYL